MSDSSHPGATQNYDALFGRPGAPFGYDPETEEPYSSKSRVAVGVLNIFLPGVGRLYSGRLALGLLQLAAAILTCGIGWLWSVTDGILVLINGSTDNDGQPLRP
ncbi:NINE protein [Hoyosella rhizosphaerae]|uniref:NINE protein n=1 Tax=Hoyosella rhizosphaerae TaxID=1755582 RepID=UPI001E5E8D8C|nr:NINE protein [Hoyosella rhizosphaerae]